MKPNSILPLISVTALVIGVSACSGDDDPSSTGLDKDDAVGWCLNFDEEAGAEVNDLPKVACSVPHSHEIFAVFDSEKSAYPGFQKLEEEAQVGCLERFEPYVEISPIDSNLFYSWMVPTLDSWEDKKISDRQIICVAGAEDGNNLTGSIEGSRR